MLHEVITTIPIVWMFMLQVYANLSLQVVPHSAEL